MRSHVLLILTSYVFLASCGGPGRRLDDVPVEKLFTLMPSEYTGISFTNTLKETQDFNVFAYRNFHNGAGVAIADFNNDGLPDIYFTANQAQNRLYLNEGDFRFRDVTREAGVGGRKPFTTGVTVADLNGDGWLDIYVSNAGASDPDDRPNELFINNGSESVPTFTESAEKYGVADRGYGVQAAFFDYDVDGDLDLYVLNNSPRSVMSFGLRNIRHVRETYGGDRLYRNDGARFKDVSEEAGIYGSEIAFGLDVTIGDVNADALPDIFVSNDFFERDYLYVNRGDGTFEEVLETWMRQTSLSSMGADMADVNNDGYPEIFVTDMLPSSDVRMKTTSTFESWQVFHEKVDAGFFNQYMRNTLHRNNRDGSFTEIGQLAGVEATDWSWGTLIADFDLDGFKDIFVTNGVFRDVTDQDFITFLGDENNARAMSRPGVGINFPELIKRIPSHRLPNHFFHNQGDLTFVDKAEEFGLDAPSYSNGTAYGDLDADGDLDLVVNNVNEPSFVYRNEADSLLRDHRFLRVKLEGEGMNRFGVGASVTARTDSGAVYLEQMPTRGFQSSVDYALVAGVGKTDTLQSVTVHWPDGRMETRNNQLANQTLTFRQKDAREGQQHVRLASLSPDDMPAPRAVSDVTGELGLAFSHRENAFIDFDREPLLLKMLSREGPRAAAGDVNGDGLTDLFIGGAKESSGALFLQRADGTMRSADVPALAEDAISEDVGAALFDADGDRDLDLYVVSGGSEYSEMAPALLDRLYLNDGRGNFTKSTGRLPPIYGSESVVTPADYDRDGDMDLFVGGRLVPWRYGLPPSSLILRNDGRGSFADVTAEVAPDLEEVGMVTDAVWSDFDRNGTKDLVLAGEWMPLTFFRNTGGRFEKSHEVENSSGWWNRIFAADLDGDGDDDYVAGNLGLNTRLRASVDEPLTMLVHDFDRNGFVDQIISYYNEGTSYPMILRADLVARLPFLEERFPTYGSYAGKTLGEIFKPEETEGGIEYAAHTMASAVLMNDGSFELRALPTEAQMAPIYAIAAHDFTGDGTNDLVIGGNFSGYKPEVGGMTESRGVLLEGKGGGALAPMAPAVSGLNLEGDVRDLLVLKNGKHGDILVVVRNNAPVQIYDIR